VNFQIITSKTDFDFSRNLKFSTKFDVLHILGVSIKWINDCYKSHSFFIKYYILERIYGKYFLFKSSHLLIPNFMTQGNVSMVTSKYYYFVFRKWFRFIYIVIVFFTHFYRTMIYFQRTIGVFHVPTNPIL